jgi:hypothetical protein
MGKSMILADFPDSRLLKLNLYTKLSIESVDEISFLDSVVI